MAIIKNIELENGIKVDKAYIRVESPSIIKGKIIFIARKYVSTNPGKVTYSYGKAKAEVDIDVHDGDMASPSVTPKKAFKTISTWNGGSKDSSRNWNRAHGYRSETTSNTLRAMA